MTPTPELINLVRQKIGETIPSDGSEADTMFTDDQITTWISAGSTVNHAVVEGWEAKLAEWASLVDVTDGAASRKLSDLIKNGEARLKYYRGLVLGGPGDGRYGRTRIGRIIRNG